MPMRTVLVYVLTLALLLPGTLVSASSIDHRLMSSFSTYIEDTYQTIYSLKVDLIQPLSEYIGLGTGLGVDAISGATPSEDTGASGGDESSTRVYPSLRLMYDDGDNIGSVGGYYSAENDYTGRSVFVDYMRIMNLGNTAAGVSAAQSFDTWGLEGLDPDKREERNVSITLSQTLSQNSQARLVWSNIYSEGYLGNPYRFLEFGTTRVLERLPESRNGNSVVLKFVTLLNDPTSLHTAYRYYSDDWSISSHTIDTTLYRDVSAKWTLGGRLRGYTQSAADFVKPIADIAQTDSEIAIDYRYSSFDTYTVGMEFLYKPDDRVGKLLDWGKAGVKGGLDIFSTSPNDFIRYWYGQDSLVGVLATVSFQYDY